VIASRSLSVATVAASPTSAAPRSWVGPRQWAMTPSTRSGAPSGV